MNSVSQAEKAGVGTLRERGDMRKGKTTVPSVSPGKTLRFFFIIYFLSYMGGGQVPVCHGTPVEVRGQLLGPLQG